MPTYRFDIYENVLEILLEQESLSYSRLYDLLVDKVGRNVSYRDYTHNLEKMVKERWLSKKDEKIRGKRVWINIDQEGKLAHKYAIMLEEWTKLRQSFLLLVISASMEMIYTEKIIDGIETTSLLENDLKKDRSAYYDIFTKDGISINDILEKKGCPPNGVFQHIIFNGSEINDLFRVLIDKKLLEKRLVTSNKEREYRYFFIESEFKNCVTSCISMLHSEVESRMFYLWRTIRKPEGSEKAWYIQLHGSQKWREIEISHFENRAYINEKQKELKKRKIDPKKSDPKTIDILNRPSMRNGVLVPYMDKDLATKRIKELDNHIISNFTELKPDLEKLLKSNDYGYYMRMLLEICLPAFIRNEFKIKISDNGDFLTH